MSGQYDNTNRGALFKNLEKEPGSNAPDYSGNLNVGGVEHFMDAWIKTSKAGKKFMSISIKQKRAKPDGGGSSSSSGGRW